jgi:hypothetical protein
MIHKHKLITAKSILLDYLGIAEAELLQIVARNHSTRSSSQADLIKLARETEAVWQRHVEQCVRDEVPVLDWRRQYFWVKKKEAQANE